MNNEIQGQTIKQNQRSQYIRLCRAYNAVDINSDKGQGEFIRLSLALHAAKGWEHITSRMIRPCYIRRCGI